MKKVIVTGIFGGGALMCLRGGFWQLRRKNWKENLIQERSQHLGKDPESISVPLPTEKEYDYLPVKTKGTFDHSKEMLMLRKYEEMNGYRVITPLFIKGKQGILVNRGWIPRDMKGKQEYRPQGEVEVEGILKPKEEKSKFVPENSIALDEWYYIDPEVMAEYSGLENPEAKHKVLQEVNFSRNRVVYQEEDFPEVPIRSVKSEFSSFTIMPETHLGYSLFWFSSAAICIAFNILILKGRL